MPKPYSRDLRERVIASIEAGASRREAAELYGISPSVVVIWAAMESDRKYRSEAEWWQYIAAGRSCRISAGPGYRASGYDPGRIDADIFAAVRIGPSCDVVDHDEYGYARLQIGVHDHSAIEREAGVG